MKISSFRSQTLNIPEAEPLASAMVLPQKPGFGVAFVADAVKRFAA
jgi:hypothetical protein